MKSSENEMGETKASTGRHLAMVCDTLDCDIADVIFLVRDESSGDELEIYDDIEKTDW